MTNKSEKMKGIVLGITLGVVSGARAGIIGALIFVTLYWVLGVALEIDDPENVRAASCIGYFSGSVAGLILGSVVGGLSGLFLSTISGAVRIAPIAGMTLGGLAGVSLVILVFVGPGTVTEYATLQWYPILIRLSAIFSGAIGGYLGGTYFQKDFLKRAT